MAYSQLNITIGVTALVDCRLRLAMMSRNHPAHPRDRTMEVLDEGSALHPGFCAGTWNVSARAMAQAPAGSTGQCKDGSYTNAASKAGACRGRKGVQQWFAADASTPAASANPSKAATAAPATTPASRPVSTPAPASAPGAAPAASPAVAPAAIPARAPKASSSMANTIPAAGGGSGMVWVNTPTNVYHCSGSRYYGKTKKGKYMTEAQAKTAGAHPDHGKGCGQ